ncbi:MAG: hypothetical protein ACP5OZ_03190 [Candidatus Woesearchaeota archaeon]
MKVSKETPLLEITLRKYERPSFKDLRTLIKKFCLCLGLLQTGDSRDIIVDVLIILLKNSKKKRELTSMEVREEVMNYRKKRKLSLNGTAHSNIRRQLLRLRELILVEKKRNKYRITEFLTMKDILNQKIKLYLINDALSRIEEYCDEIDRQVLTVK